MSKNLFEQINEVTEELKNLKGTIKDLKISFDKSNFGDISSTLKSLNLFFQQTISSLSDLKKSVYQLSSKIEIHDEILKKSVLFNQSLNSNNDMAVETIPVKDISKFTPKNNIIAPKQKLGKDISFESQIPSLPSISQSSVSKRSIIFAYPAPATSTTDLSSNSLSEYEKIIIASKNKTLAKDLGNMIDQLRSELSKINSLNPILFELNMEAGRLKSIGEKSLNPKEIQNLEKKIKKWKLNK